MTAAMVRELWAVRRGQDGIRGNPKFVMLYDSGEYSQLADYLIKETERTFRDEDSAVKQRYSCSRNLTKPKKDRGADAGQDLETGSAAAEGILHIAGQRFLTDMTGWAIHTSGM